MSRRDFDPAKAQSVTQRYRHAFRDKRLEKRFRFINENLKKSQSSVLQKTSYHYKDIVGFQRFVQNSDVTLPELIYESTRISPELVKGKNLIVPLDESTITLLSKKTTKQVLIENLGIGGNNKTAGLIMMSSVVMDEDSHEILGLGDMVQYTVPMACDSPKENIKLRDKRKKQPFEFKSSSIWDICSSNTTQNLDLANSITYIADQGADCINSIFNIIEKDKQHLIVRAKTTQQRIIKNEDGKEMTIAKFSDSLTSTGKKSIKLRELNHFSTCENTKKVRKKRDAQLNIKYGLVTLIDENGIEKKVNYVEAKEDSSTVPVGEDPIFWCLFTDRSVENLQDALKIIDLYALRWVIEQLHRLAKSEGFEIEQTLLRSPEAIKKLVIMTFKASLEALQLVNMRENEEVDAKAYFEESEIEVLEGLLDELNGSTNKQKNLYRKGSIAWACWIIARLGGWTGYTYHRKPGPITFTDGLISLRSMVWCHNILKKKST